MSQVETNEPVKIGGHETIITYYLPKLLEAYCKRNPMTRFVIQPTPVSSLKNEVLADSIDLAFILEKPFHRQGLTVHTYQAEEIVLVCSPTHTKCQMLRFWIKLRQ